MTPTPKKDPKSYVIEAVSRALEVLELMTNNTSVGVTEVATELGMQKNNAFRILSTLSDSGFVVQNSETERYELTNKLQRLSGSTSLQNGERIAQLAGQILSIVEGRSQDSNRVEIVVQESTEDTVTATEEVTNGIGD